MFWSPSLASAVAVFAQYPCHVTVCVPVGRQPSVPTSFVQLYPCNPVEVYVMIIMSMIY